MKPETPMDDLDKLVEDLRTDARIYAKGRPQGMVQLMPTAQWALSNRLERAATALLQLQARALSAERQLAEAREALKDMREGWRYIRQNHGDLYGVGWDRAEKAADAALAIGDTAPTASRALGGGE